MRALLIGPDERKALQDLAARAADAPVYMPTLTQRIKTPEGKAAHMEQMTAQSVDIPMGYGVTFSIEVGHPLGACRHLSVYINDAPDKLPHPAAVWAIAKELGFWGEIEQCDGIWPEKLRQGQSINLVQRMEQGPMQ